jgi:hypothetical protein
MSVCLTDQLHVGYGRVRLSHAPHCLPNAEPDLKGRSLSTRTSKFQKSQTRHSVLAVFLMPFIRAVVEANLVRRPFG